MSVVGSLRKKEKKELEELLKEARLELIKLRSERKVGSLADGSAVKKKRREIAQALTILKEMEVLSEMTAKGGPAPGVLREEKVKEKEKKIKKPRVKGRRDAKKKT